MYLAFQTRLNLSILVFGSLFLLCPLFVMGVDELETNLAQEDMEVITVTARRIEEPLHRVPISVDILSGEELKEKGIENIADLSGIAPNVQLASSAALAGTANAPVIFIRGIGQQDFLITSEPAVGIYLDDVFISKQIGSLLDLIDLESVEILRGPQGSLYGRNTIGGAIKLRSAMPHSDTAFNGQLSLGEFNLKSARITANLPISDNTALRVTGLTKQQDGYVNLLRYDDLKLGSVDLAAMRAQLHWQANSDVVVYVSADYSQDRSNPSPFSAEDIHLDAPLIRNANKLLVKDGVALCDSLSTIATSTSCVGPAQLSDDPYRQNQQFFDEFGQQILPQNDLNTWGTALNLQWQTEWASITSISAIRRLESRFSNSLSWGPVLSFQNNNRVYDNESISQEFRLQGEIEKEQINWELGLFWFKEVGQERVEILHSGGSLAPFEGSAIIYDSRDTDNRSLAFYGHGIWQIDALWQVALGARWSQDKKGFSLDPGHKLFPGTQPLEGQRDLIKWVPKLSVSYFGWDDIMLYTSFAKGYRNGGFPARLLEPPSVATQVPNFDPEFVTTYELGAKSYHPSRKLSWNLAIFDSDYSGKQETAIPIGATGLDAVTAVQNIGDATLRGVEWQLGYLGGDQFDAQISLGYLDAKWNTITNGGAVGVNGITIDTDKTLPYSPKWNTHIGVNYYLPSALGGEYRLHLDWKYTARQEFRSENIESLSQDAYHLFNLGLSYRTADNRWRFKLTVKNLLDKYYSMAGTTNFATHGMTVKNVSRPRTASFTIEYTWD